jgi:hypothetical protein
MRAIVHDPVVDAEQHVANLRGRRPVPAQTHEPAGDLRPQAESVEISDCGPAESGRIPGERIGLDQLQPSIVEGVERTAGDLTFPFVDEDEAPGPIPGVVRRERGMRCFVEDDDAVGPFAEQVGRCLVVELAAGEGRHRSVDVGYFEDAVPDRR